MREVLLPEGSMGKLSRLVKGKIPYGYLKLWPDGRDATAIIRMEKVQWDDIGGAEIEVGKSSEQASSDDDCEDPGEAFPREMTSVEVEPDYFALMSDLMDSTIDTYFNISQDDPDARYLDFSEIEALNWEISRVKGAILKYVQEVFEFRWLDKLLERSEFVETTIADLYDELR
jgi:hypothetical protein